MLFDFTVQRYGEISYHARGCKRKCSRCGEQFLWSLLLLSALLGSFLLTEDRDVITDGNSVTSADKLREVRIQSVDKWCDASYIHCILVLMQRYVSELAQEKTEKATGLTVCRSSLVNNSVCSYSESLETRTLQRHNTETISANAHAFLAFLLFNNNYLL